MTQSMATEKLVQIVQRMNPQNKLLRTWQLKGGVSAQMTALEVRLPDGQLKKLILRQHGATDFNQNPNIAADEYNLLQILHRAGVAVPRPYYIDQSGEIFSKPYLLIEYVAGLMQFVPVDLPDYLRQIATNLATIHQVNLSKHDLSFLPQQKTRCTKMLIPRPSKLDVSIDEGRIRDILEVVWPLPQKNAGVLLHGDFWSGNLLWQAGQLVAIVDWEDAALGDPLSDLAKTRLEMLWAFGLDAMCDFTAQYRALMPQLDFIDLPYWDLWAALHPAFRIAEFAAGWHEFGRDDVTEKTMRNGHRLFVSQAIERLAEA